ncbi:MAG: hypothetical protein P8166_10760, partial [Candidatus Thiodiazotropha sp.]
IFVSLGLHPAASEPDSMNRLEGPGPEVTNRVGSYIGPMAASFQVNPGDAPGAGGGLWRPRCYHYPTAGAGTQRRLNSQPPFTYKEHSV